MALLAATEIPILFLSGSRGFSITQPRDLKYCIMLRDIMRRIKGMQENWNPYFVGGIAKSTASVL